MSALRERLRLVVVTPGTGRVEPICERVRGALAGGATAIWIRERGLAEPQLRSLCRRVRSLTDERGAAVLVSGRPDIAVELELDGVHLGFRDPKPGTIRREPRAWIGFSAHDPLDEKALVASDYATLSPLFPTAKADSSLGTQRFAALRRRIACPVIALGGIDRHNAAAALAAGADGIAVLGAVETAADAEAACRELRRALDGSTP